MPLYNFKQDHEITRVTTMLDHYSNKNGLQACNNVRIIFKDNINHFVRLFSKNIFFVEFKKYLK